MISTHDTAGITVRITVEALAVPDHVKFHVRHRRQGAPESVVEEPKLTLLVEGAVIVRGANSSRAAHQRGLVCYAI
jgi:hypothetical protein